MKNLILVLVLALGVVAAGCGANALWRGKPQPPVEVTNYWDGLFKIQPYCKNQVTPGDQAAYWKCSDCERAKLGKKFNMPGEVATYGGACPAGTF